jgi:hypothetical protein
MSFPNRIASLACLVLLHAVPAAAVDITSCGEIVPAGQTGVLMADLDCTASPVDVPNVELRAGATLDMNGHSLSRQDPGNGIAILCPSRSRCTIKGPGTIFGHVIASSGGNQVIEDVTVQDVESGILAYIHGTPRLGKLRLTNVTVTGAEYAGVYANRVTAENLQVVGTEEGFGIYGGVRGTNIVASDNGGGGIVGKRVRIDGLVATNNGGGGAPFSFGGVYAPSGIVSLRNSTVTGNQADYSPETSGQIDIIARRARLANTTCGHSVYDDAVGLDSLGVCAGD